MDPFIPLIRNNQNKQCRSKKKMPQPQLKLNDYREFWLKRRKLQYQLIRNFMILNE